MADQSVTQQPTKILGRERALLATKAAADIAEILFRFHQDVDGICAGMAWTDLPSLHQTFFRGKAEKAIISLDVLAEDRAKSRASAWIQSKQEYDYRDDFNTFPTELVSNTIDMAIWEYEHQLRRCFDEDCGVRPGPSVRGKCRVCGGILTSTEDQPISACENCGYHERRTR